MMKRKTSDMTVYIIFVVLIFIFGVSAQLLNSAKFEPSIDAGLQYDVESYPLDYRVYYSENQFYFDEYIEANKTYVQEYVSKISADFSYSVKYNDKLTKGYYDYYVKAKLIAYTPGNEEDDLWIKEYNLSEPENVGVNNDSSYQIKKSVDIDYQMFKNDFESYRSVTGVNASAKLVVELVVNNKGEYPDLDGFEYSSSVKMEMPLSDSTFKIKTYLADNEGTHRIVKINEQDHEKMYRQIIVILLWILTIFTTVVLLIVYRFNKNKTSYYERKLRKILLANDEVIVNVEKLPSLTSLSVVDVVSFEELLDAQREVRLPINFKEDKKKRTAKFVLIHDNLAWVYTLDESNLLEDTK